jgi:hypothetical protein
MTAPERDEFPATALIDTYLKVLDVRGAGEELVEAVADLVKMGRIGDAPDGVHDADGARHLVWRGYITGGLITAWLRLGGALRRASISAFLGDPRLDVFVPAEGEVVVFGVLRRAIRLTWEEWDEKVRAADSVEDLVAGFVQAALSDAPLFERPTRESPTTGEGDEDQEAFPEMERVHEPTLWGARPEMIEQLAPGEIDWELVEESDAALTISCDPEGNVTEESVVCYLMRWRTEFAAPGTVLDDEPWQDSFEWAVGQWQWVGEGSDEDDDRNTEIGSCAGSSRPPSASCSSTCLRSCGPGCSTRRDAPFRTWKISAMRTCRSRSRYRGSPASWPRSDQPAERRRAKYIERSQVPAPSMSPWLPRSVVGKVAPAPLELLGREPLAPGTFSQCVHRRANMPREQEPPVLERLNVPLAGKLRLREHDRLRHVLCHLLDCRSPHNQRQLALRCSCGVWGLVTLI